MIPLVNDNSPNAINTSLIAVKRELQTLLDAIKKINPTQEIIEQGGGSIEDVTQAEYDALTPAQQDDGTVRVITDSEPQEIEIAGHLIDDNAVANNKTWSSERINAQNSYSYSEVDTGKTWVTGKKIYRRVFNFGVETSTVNRYSIASLNYENIVSAEVAISEPAFYIMSGMLSTSNANYTRNWYIDKNSKELVTEIGQMRSKANSVVLVIEYTKI